MSYYLQSNFTPSAYNYSGNIKFSAVVESSGAGRVDINLWTSDGTDGFNGYIVLYSAVSGEQPIQIKRVDNGTATDIGSYSGAANAAALTGPQSLVFVYSATGIITAFFNGTIVATTTDTTYVVNGPVGYAYEAETGYLSDVSIAGHQDIQSVYQDVNGRATNDMSQPGNINQNTTYLTDGANLGQTSNWGGIPDIPDTISGHNLSATVQSLLPTTSGTKHVWASDSGGAPYETGIYGTETNLGWQQPSNGSSTSNTPAQLGTTMVITNPGQKVSILAIGAVSAYYVSTAGYGAGYIDISIDGGVSWDHGNDFVSYVASTCEYNSCTGLTSLQNVTPTGDIHVRMMVFSGAAYTVDWNDPAFTVLVMPQSNFSTLGATLSASIPSTGTGSGYSLYPTTSSTAANSVAVTIGGGTPAYSPTWAIVSGPGTIYSGKTSTTVVIHDSETGTTAGAVFTTVIDCNVIDAASGNVTTGNCTLTNTFYVTYGAITQSLTASDGGCAGLGSCAATGLDKSVPSGGNGVYTYSWSISSQSLPTATLSSATSATCTLTQSHTTIGSPTNDINMSSYVHDSEGTPKTNTSTNQVTLEFTHT